MANQETNNELALLKLRCVHSLVSCGRLGIHFLLQHDIIRVLVRTLRLAQLPELSWQAICTLQAIAQAGERGAILEAGGLDVLVPRLCHADQSGHQLEDFDLAAIPAAAAEALTVLLQSVAVKKALFGSKLLKQVLSGIEELLSAESNRSVSCSLLGCASNHYTVYLYLCLCLVFSLILITLHYTHCYNEIEGAQGLKICPYADSLKFSPTVIFMYPCHCL